MRNSSAASLPQLRRGVLPRDHLRSSGTSEAEQTRRGSLHDPGGRAGLVL